MAAIRGWRIVREKYAASAFSGIGAQQSGGRFNSPGTAVVYVADSYALALLEVRVHVPTFRGLRDRVVIEVEMGASLIERLVAAELPDGWQDRPPSRAAQLVGDRWAREGRSAVLQVPSVVVPGHVNYLLNPAHPDFAQIRTGAAERVVLDPRLD